MAHTRMIERVARAIAEAQGHGDWQSQVATARAAVAALREPTVEMLEAALPRLPDWGYFPEEWQNMIACVAGEPLQ